MTTTTLDVDRWRIVQRLSTINAAIAELAAEAESLKGELRNLAPGDYTDPDGRPVVRLAANRRFDAAAALTAIPVDDRAAYLKVSIDADALRKNLTPAQVDGFMVEAGRPKVSLL